MSDVAVLIRDRDADKISIAVIASESKERALATASLVQCVNTPAQNELAIQAMQELKNILAWAEKSRKSVKQPVLDLGRDIDGKAKQFTKGLQEEYDRISGMASDYAALEITKSRASESANKEYLTLQERDRQQQLANASNLDDVDRINAEFDQSAAEFVAKEPEKAEGQTNREDWTYEVTNFHLLYANHPDLVELKDKRREIKAALNAGKKITGIKAWPTVTASVRASGVPQLEGA